MTSPVFKTNSIVGTFRGLKQFQDLGIRPLVEIKCDF